MSKKIQMYDFIEYLIYFWGLQNWHNLRVMFLKHQSTQHVFHSQHITYNNLIWYKTMLFTYYLLLVFLSLLFLFRLYLSYFLSLILLNCFYLKLIIIIYIIIVSNSVDSISILALGQYHFAKAKGSWAVEVQVLLLYPKHY